MYGFTVHSQLSLPELSSGEGSADIVLHLGQIDQAPPEGGGARSSRLSPEEGVLFWKGVGKVLVRNGSQIIVDPIPGVEEELVRLFVLGSAMGLLLHQRGLLVLHGSSVAIDGGVSIFLGESGWGKSTTAAAFHARGHCLMADDITAVQMDLPQSVVLPGYPHIKLWPESARALGIDPDRLPRLHSHVDKRVLHTVSPPSALPLRSIYILARDAESGIDILSPQSALVQLLSHTYVARWLLPTGTAPTHMRQCAKLVATVPIRRLRVCGDLDALSRLVDRVEADLSGVE